ncbi:MAG TPA: hypothetical protein VGV93_12055 [Acidimicrobiales bacterium]|nr:hypothetical protein [Acidimicrobiales bacterium]
MRNLPDTCRPHPVRTRVDELATALVMVVGTQPRPSGAPAGDIPARVEGAPTSAELAGAAMERKITDWLDQLRLWASVASLLVGAGAWDISQQLADRYRPDSDRAARRSGAATVSQVSQTDSPHRAMAGPRAASGALRKGRPADSLESRPA